jgi:hypothetical protein
VNVTGPNEVPKGVPTVTVLVVRSAVDEIAQVALTLVPAAFAATPLQVTPAPLIVTAVAPPRFVPAMVTGTFAEPDPGRTPDVGVIDEIFTKLVVSVAVLLAVFESVTPAGVATLTTFDIEVALVATIARAPAPERLPRNVKVAVPPAGSVTVPVRVVVPPAFAKHEAPALAVQVQPLTVSTWIGRPSAVTVGNVSVTLAPVTAVGPLLVTTMM